MIRQDQISGAALEYCRTQKDSELSKENLALIAFADGANWADKNKQKEQYDPQNGYRQEVANTARRIFVNEPTMSVVEAFELAEKFANAKREYLKTGDPATCYCKK